MLVLQNSPFMIVDTSLCRHRLNTAAGERGANSWLYGCRACEDLLQGSIKSYWCSMIKIYLCLESDGQKVYNSAAELKRREKIKMLQLFFPSSFFTYSPLSFDFLLRFQFTCALWLQSGAVSYSERVVCFPFSAAALVSIKSSLKQGWI